MIKMNIHSNYELLYIIVAYGKGSSILQFAKKNGVSGGTVLFGTGTVVSPLLELLDLSDTRKEILLMACESQMISSLSKRISEKFKFHKKHHGIAFSIPITNILGAHSCQCEPSNTEGGQGDKMYNAVFVIVDKGKGNLVVDTARDSGSKGATIINGRGSGVHESNVVFGMDIEPEKELVLILSKVDTTDKIVDAIRLAHKIDEPGNGIIFIQNVSKTYGLYD